MKHILVVDDDGMNCILAKHALGNQYRVTTVSAGTEAIAFLKKEIPDLILMDIEMPQMSGLETVSIIKENEEWAQIPIIFLTADSTPETEAQCLSDGADDFIAKPFVPQVMQSRISRILELSELRNGLETKLAEKTKQVELVTLNAIMAIANTIEAKDVYTSGHSNRVARYAVEIARRMGWQEEDVKNLNFMALLHDIGKIGVPDVILNKPHPLNDDEFAIIKKHPAIGGEILKSITAIPDVHIGALYHHERYDGKGYPVGLKGEDIPFEARIIAIADTYDAMASNRAYRHALTEENIITELKKCRGAQLDPAIAQIFIDMLEEGFFWEQDGGVL